MFLYLHMFINSEENTMERETKGLMVYDTIRDFLKNHKQPYSMDITFKIANVHGGSLCAYSVNYKKRYDYFYDVTDIILNCDENTPNTYIVLETNGKYENVDTRKYEDVYISINE